MRKVWLVFEQDLRNIFTNGITFVTIVILLIVPALFVGFTIKANWVPINNSRNVKVALVNKDLGGIINNVAVNIGEEVLKEVGQDTSVTWQVVSYENALRGLLIGEYYGVIVIPQTFTEGMATFMTDTPILPKISYVMNVRENVFTPTFTETSSTRLQIYVAHSITSAINQAVENILGALDVNIKINNTAIKGVVETLLDLDKNKEVYIDKIKEYREIVGNVMMSLSNLEDELPDLNERINGIEALSKTTNQFIETTNKLGIESNETKQLVDEFKEVAAYIKEEIPKLQEMIKASNDVIGKVYGDFSRVDSTVTNITRDLRGLEYKLGFLAQDDEINKLIYILENDPELVKACIESPALLENKEIKILPNYGSALAPFNITVAMWMGTTILITILSTRFQSDESSLEEEGQQKNIIVRDNITDLQEYFGKGLFFVFLSCVQDIITILVAKQILGVYITHMGLFLCMGIIGSITFTAIIYTLVRILGNVGKIFTYTLSVLQLFFLGGVFPIQIIPPLFQWINKTLPFIYIIASFREVQIGIITTNLLKSIMILLSFTLGAIIWGIVGTLFLAPYIEVARVKIRASHLGKQDY